MPMPDDPGDRPHFYSFKSSVGGVATELELHDDALAYRKGMRAVRVPYGDIRQVRLAYRPMTIQSHRFIAEIWPKAGGKLTMASTSWRSIMEQQRQDAPYSAFVAELHRRIFAAGGGTKFRTGSPPVLFWIGAAVVAGIAIASLIFAFDTLAIASWANAAIFAGILALFFWQMGMFIYRNRPGTYAPDRLPRRVLP